MRRDFSFLELAAELQAHEPAVGVAGHRDVVLFLNIANQVEIGVHDLGVGLEAVVVDDRIDPLVQGREQPVDR